MERRRDRLFAAYDAHFCAVGAERTGPEFHIVASALGNGFTLLRVPTCRNLRCCRLDREETESAHRKSTGARSIRSDQTETNAATVWRSHIASRRFRLREPSHRSIQADPEGPDPRRRTEQRR